VAGRLVVHNSVVSDGRLLQRVSRFPVDHFRELDLNEACGGHSRVAEPTVEVI